MAAAAHVFVADLARPELGPDDRHHLERVLRLRPGEEVTASDGVGGWRRCHYRSGGLLEAASEIEVVARLQPPVTVAFALAKGDRPEWTVQKLVEVGADRIVPMTTSRSVVRWEGERATRQVARLRSVALAAAMQSRQVWLPAVDDLLPFAQVAASGLSGAGPASSSGLSGAGPASSSGLSGGQVPASSSGLSGGEVAASGLSGAGPAALAERGGDPPDLARPTILVGPEGGWDEWEQGCGLPRVGLGPAVLRSETAAMAAGLLLCALRSGVVRPA